MMVIHKRVVDIMSMFGSKCCYLKDPDPYMCCYHGYTEHPHYKDCANCFHEKFCEIHALDVALEESNRAIELSNRLLESFKPKRRKLP